MRHKHHKEIKAWADGAEIEWTYSGTLWQQTNVPSWFEDYKYRVKPAEPVYEWRWVLQNLEAGYSRHGFFVSAACKTEEEVRYMYEGYTVHERLESSKREVEL
jgi:hypothetical protein